MRVQGRETRAQHVYGGVGGRQPTKLTPVLWGFSLPRH